MVKLSGGTIVFFECEYALFLLQVLEVIERGLCIRNYPDDIPWPSALFFAMVNGRPLHVVASLSTDERNVRYNHDIRTYVGILRT